MPVGQLDPFIRENHFPSLEWVCPGFGFAFPVCNAAAKSHYHGRKECLIHAVVFYTVLPLMKNCNFTAMRSRKRTSLTAHPTDPEAADLIAPWTCLLKTQLGCQQGDSSLKGRSSTLQMEFGISISDCHMVCHMVVPWPEHTVWETRGGHMRSSCHYEAS